ncbi:unnamed protein product [Paramecium sonneborni]|uniref:Transmembrane protein n=1 Tax=Paramecium sonneborni TaxID=65129 RepID=A0A8S1MDU9_9CILI|nr:unnamed protein product [Paramecium sonneborni]
MLPLKFLHLQTIILFLTLILKDQAMKNPDQCQKIILKKNEKICGLNEINSYFIGQNSIDLTNQSTYQDFEDLIEISNGPILYSQDDLIFTMKFRQLINENEICSLIYKSHFNAFSINCISTQTTYIIDNQFKILINKQYQIDLEIEKNFNCSSFDYNIEDLIIFCYSFDSIRLYKLSKEEEKFKQSIRFQSEMQKFQCLLKFHSSLDLFFIIYLQCQEWKIQIYENNSLKLQIDEIFFKEKANVQGELLDVLICQQNLVILLSSGGFQFFNYKLKELFIVENLKLNETLIEFDNFCSIKFVVKGLSNEYFRSSLSDKYKDLLLNTKEFPKKAFSIQNPNSLLLKYENFLIFYVNNHVHQSFKIQLKDIFQLSNQNIYIGIEEGNQIKLVLIKYLKQCIPYYDKNQQFSKYYLQFIYTNFPPQNEFINCYLTIIIDNDELIKKNALQIDLVKKNSYIKRKNYEENFQMSFRRSSFQSIKPFKINFHSSFNQIQFSIKDNQLKCKFNYYLKNYKGKFVIRTNQNRIYSIIVQVSGNQTREYYCEDEQIYLQLNILSLNEQSLNQFLSPEIFVLLDQQKSVYLKFFQIMSKIACFETQVENLFSTNNGILIKFKDQEVFQKIIYSSFQIIIEKYKFPSELSLNFQDLLHLNHEINIFVYINQLKIIYKQKIVQIINIRAKVLGLLPRFQSKQIRSLILLDINKNELQFYQVSIIEFFQTTTYDLKDYVPIQPLSFKIYESLLIISCQHKINQKIYILIFNCAFSSSLYLLQQVIETQNYYFWVQDIFLYYFNNKNILCVQDLIYINIEIQYDGFNNKTSQELSFQLEIEMENIGIPPVKHDFNITFINPSILQIINNNSKLLIQQQNQQINFRNFFLGKIDNIILKSNNDFELKYPLEQKMVLQCSYYNNKFCFSQSNNEHLIFFRIGLIGQTFLVYNLQQFIFNLTFIEQIQEDQFLLLNQINNITLQLSLVQLKNNLFTLKKQLNAEPLQNQYQIAFKQNILLIQKNEFKDKYLVDINEWFYTSLNMVGQIYSVNSEKYLQLFYNPKGQIILINLFQISNQQVKFYQKFEILIRDSQIKDYILKQSSYNFTGFIKQNLTQNNQIDLSLLLINYQQEDVYCLIRLYLDDQKHEFINIKILRYPQFVQPCEYLLLTDEEIILMCGLIKYFFNMKNSELFCDPIFSTKDLEKIEIFNSTHFLYQYYSQQNQSIVINIGQRGGYYLQKLSKTETQSMSLEFQAINIEKMKMSQVALHLQVVQAKVQQDENFSISFILFLIIILLLLASILFLYKKRQRKQIELKKIFTAEISLTETRLKIKSNN